MKIAVYMRVSTLDQKTDSQKHELRQWLKAHGHDLKSVQWFEDQVTGSTMKRDGLAALNAAVFAGTVNMVVVWKLDRIARSHREGIDQLYDWCDAGVRVVSVTQQIDLSGKMAKVIAGVLFGLAEIDLTNIRERQAAGIANAKEKGIYKGRKKGTLKNKPERARELRAQGLKPAEIMSAMNISRSTLYRYLEDT